jgi:hypothetical protein
MPTHQSDEDVKSIDWQAINEARAAIEAPRIDVRFNIEDQVKRVAYDFNDTKQFPKSLTRVEIIHITDLQIGHKNFNRDRFVEYRSWILSKPNRFVLFGGDLIDAATKLSIGSPYENNWEPQGQVKVAVNLLKPLTEAGRVLGSVGGNHERRTSATFGDAGVLISDHLKIPYSAGVQLIDIQLGDHNPFKISMWHGGGSAKTKGAKAQMLHRFMQQHSSHLYLVGHLHDCIVIPDWRIERDENDGLKQVKIMGIMSSSFMSYWNSYAEIYALSPSETMMGRVVLTPDGKWEATLR